MEDVGNRPSPVLPLFKLEELNGRSRKRKPTMESKDRFQEILNVLGENRVRSALETVRDVEAGRRLLKIQRLRRELCEFEEKFEMESAEAWKRFNDGELGDDMDVMEWMALYENLQDFQKDYDRVRHLEIRR